ncbi:hypothetical protein GCM10010862_31170 [Devosia nitrariae]|uniref:RES domain-containing protein n=1 Tax=Devosia nitrariae TaxID=2071872 RepID=A0ABQ5W735_9HYPH|nr:hypothetical protein GCM10010862_31170 [Devosia nitrariae]
MQRALGELYDPLDVGESQRFRGHAYGHEHVEAAHKRLGPRHVHFAVLSGSGRFQACLSNERLSRPPLLELSINDLRLTSPALEFHHVEH